MEEGTPKAFFWRRMHSIMGLWLTVFLIEHLLTNSQAAYFIGQDGHGFIHAVNWLHDIPYLPVVEMIILAVPIIIHTIWGIKYARTAKYNSFKTDGSSPSLPQYGRNKAYTWQRITAWILMVGIVAHVIQMRFVEYPDSVQQGDEKLYMIRVSLDPGLYTLSQRLGVALYDKKQILSEREEIGPKAPPVQKQKFRAFLTSISDMFKADEPIVSVKDSKILLQAQQFKQQQNWVKTLEKRSLSENQVIAVTRDFGTAELLMVRDTFKMPSMIVLYTLLVLSACFHGFNGLWTFMITWGVTLNQRSQTLMLNLSTGLMVLLSFLGLSAVWFTYWINLRT